MVVMDKWCCLFALSSEKVLMRRRGLCILMQTLEGLSRFLLFKIGPDNKFLASQKASPLSQSALGSL